MSGKSGTEKLNVLYFFRCLKKINIDSPLRSEADFEDFINNLCNHSKAGGANSAEQNKGDNRKRKTKRKK